MSSGGPQSKIKRKRKEWKVLTPCLRTRKAMEHEGDCYARDDPQSLGKWSWKSWKLEDEQGPTKLQQCQDWPE